MAQNTPDSDVAPVAEITAEALGHHSVFDQAVAVLICFFGADAKKASRCKCEGSPARRPLRNLAEQIVADPPSAKAMWA